MSRHPIGPRGSIVAATIALIVSVVAGCMPSPTTPTPSPAPTVSEPAATASGPAPSASGPAASASVGPSAAASAAELLPISGVWRVRKVLLAADQSEQIGDPTFDEET